MSSERRRFVVVRRREVDVYGETRVIVCARTVEAASAEEAASQDDVNDSSIVELRVIPVDDARLTALRFYWAQSGEGVDGESFWFRAFLRLWAVVSWLRFCWFVRGLPRLEAKP